MSGHQRSNSQQNQQSKQAQRIWLEWVEAAFPDLNSRSYFLPPVYFNRVSMTTESIAEQNVLVLCEAPGEAQSPPGQATQSTPGQAAPSTPSQAAQSTPSQAAQSTPGQATQSTPGQAALSTPGQAAQSPPGQAAQSTPEQAAQSTPGQAAQSTPGQAAKPTPGQAALSTPGQAAQSPPGQAAQSTPGQAAQSTPGQAAQSTPGQAAQSTPGQAALSPPGQAAPSTPGQAAQSTPGQTAQSTPGQAAQSTPGQTAQSPPGQAAQSPPPCQNSDVRDDAALQRILCCLQKMSEENKEVLFGLSQLQFGQYLGEPCYTAAAANLPVPANLPSKRKQGDFDVLIIHRHYGLVVCEVKAFGDNVKTLNMSQQDIDKNIRKKLTQAVSQLDKAEAMLSHLVSDVTPGLRITKTIAVPNLTARQVQEAISGDQLLTKNLCGCLGATDLASITALCICSDQLSDPKTQWDVTPNVLSQLRNWWRERVIVSGPDSHMTCDVYKTLVARFCGPATTVTVPCTSPPRLCVKTLGQAVSWTGECYTAQITLFPEQVDLLNTAPSRVFVAGPPGTGKTVVLLLVATEWLRCRNDVHVVSTCPESLAACSMLYHLLLETVNTQLASEASRGQLYFQRYNFQEEGVEKAVNDLSVAGKPLYVIADEVVETHFRTFCDHLLTQVPDLHLWAASCFHAYAPAGWQVEYLTRPLRSPPVVVREVENDVAFTVGCVVQAYSKRGVPDHTDGPPITPLYHQGQDHSDFSPTDCVACGRELAAFLHSLRVPGKKRTSTTVTTTKDSTTPPRLQWRDMLVLSEFGDVKTTSKMVKGLDDSGIPVRVMEDNDTEDVTRACSDIVWVTHPRRVHGLERKVVVCVEPAAGLSTVRLYSMSRCTSQLVFVSAKW